MHASAGDAAAQDGEQWLALTTRRHSNRVQCLLHFKLGSITKTTRSPPRMPPRQSRAFSPDASKNAPSPRDASRLPEAQSFSTLYIFCCIGYYFVVSLSLTFLNKMVLTTMIKFACPLFMTWLQFVVAFACLKALGLAGRWIPSIPDRIGICDYSFSPEIFKNTFRLGLAYTAMYAASPVAPHRAPPAHLLC